MDIKIRNRKSIKNIEKQIIWFCIKSRLFIILLQYISNLIIPDHDSGTFLVQIDPQQQKPSSYLDQIIYHLFSGFLRWDAQYFLHILHYGYTYENVLAFFPIYPILIKICSFPIQILFGNFINNFSIYILTIIFVNNLIFIKTALVLYSLTLAIFKNYNYAYTTAILFAFNPASIFFSAAYSESLFAFLSFSAMLKCFITILISIIPFLLIQIYNYTSFCMKFNSNLPQFLIDYGLKNNYKMAAGENVSIWCSYTIPFAYSYVQRVHWDVGFLKYYQFKQIPNFLLASPIIFIMIQQFIDYVQMKLLRLKINFLDFVFVVHAFSLTIFCIFFVHIQVTTRMLCSASPILYWYCADKWLNGLNKNSLQLQPNFLFLFKNVILAQKCIQFYFFTYFVVGTILFSNFLPWT
ncbi:GPI mannosyltransferase 2 [Chrysoperla carnea]|uniref:GPI mannosyltransferase 2 n=1 Tax=Chrysoperla carnea TaxID=189513 RepID=UPI001D094EE0|nr:GPI mannosyltransferase 2 [Chrysoperla carnea]